MPAHAGVKQLLSKDHRQTSLGVLGLLAVPGPGVLELCPAPLSAGAPTAPFSLLTSAQPLVLGPPCPTSSLRAPAPESRPPSDQRSCYGTEVTLTQPPVQTSRPGAGSLTKLSLSASCTLGWPRCFRPPGNRQGPTPPVQTSRAVIAGWVVSGPRDEVPCGWACSQGEEPGCGGPRSALPPHCRCLSGVPDRGSAGCGFSLCRFRDFPASVTTLLQARQGDLQEEWCQASLRQRKAPPHLPVHPELRLLGEVCVTSV